MIQVQLTRAWRGIAIALMLASVGCSTFNRDWKAAAGQPAEGVAGRWEGKWHSDHNGHSGGLRALVRKLDNGQYEARFHATYATVLSFSSKVDLDVRHTGAEQTFTGTADLGKAAGGVYHYAGKASETNFFSTFKCPSDHGTFQMGRPK